jgi:hypothetical protein
VTLFLLSYLTISEETKFVMINNNDILFGEASGSQGGEYEDFCRLGCFVVQSGRSLPMFQKYLLPPEDSHFQYFIWHAKIINISQKILKKPPVLLNLAA